MRANLSGVKPAEESRPLTKPGTIAAFTIEEIEYKDQDGKEWFEVTFGNEDSSFREYFYLTEKAAPRFVYLYEKVTGSDAVPEHENGIIAALKGRKIALKVIGRVNETNGKGFPCLPFAGFARPVNQIEELSFNSRDKENIRAALDAIQNASAPAPQPTDPAQGQAESDDLPF